MYDKRSSANKTVNTTISVEEFKRRTNSGFDFFDYIMRKHNVILRQNNNFQILNPFYDDTHASMSINRKNGEYLFYDFGDEQYKGDVISFAGFYYNLNPKSDLPEILKRACQDLGINGSNEVSANKNIRAVVKTTSENKTNDYNILKFRKYNKNDLQFWGQYGISESILKKYRVFPIFEIIKDKDQNTKIFLYKYKPDDPMYAYMADDRSFQAYRPNNKKYKFRWYSNKPDNFIFGFEQLPETSNYVILTGGQKDVLSLVSHGFPAITLNSETAKIPVWLLYELKKRFESIVVLYDIDETGLKQSDKLTKENKLVRIVLPNELISYGKDISDYFKAMISKSNKDIFNIDYLKDLIHKTIKNYQKELQKNISIRTANQRMRDARNQPDIKMLVDVIWMTGELHLLFADTGLGKSAWAVQISDSLSKGNNVLILKNENKLLRVLHYDFELSDKQFWKRYSDINSEYKFSENLYIDTINLGEMFAEKDFNDYENLLFIKICDDIEHTQAEILVIDNLTYLDSQTTSEVKIAQKVMIRLNELKKKYRLSILVIAHTVKKYFSSPITLNDMAGSKMLSNFADSVSAIGLSSEDRNLRYIKQLKPSRSAEIKYTKDNVIVCRLRKENSFLGLEFVEFSQENHHLGNYEDRKTPDLLPEVAERVNSKEPYSIIAENLNISKGTISKWKKEYPEHFNSVSTVSIVSGKGALGNEETEGNDNIMNNSYN